MHFSRRLIICIAMGFFFDRPGLKCPPTNAGGSDKCPDNDRAADLRRPQDNQEAIWR